MGTNEQNTGLFTGLIDTANTVAEAKPDYGMLSGYIVKYDPQRGFGFVRDDEHNDYYFHIKAFKEKGEPEVGRYVKYVLDARKPKDGHKKSVKEFRYDAEQTDKVEAVSSGLSKVKCPGCGRYIIPRYYHDRYDVSSACMCPFCHKLFNATYYERTFIDNHPVLIRRLFFYPPILLLLIFLANLFGIIRL